MLLFCNLSLPNRDRTCDTAPRHASGSARLGWHRGLRLTVPEILLCPNALAGLALVCMAVGALLLVLAACMPTSTAGGDAQGTDVDVEEQRTAFIKDGGYTKM